MGVDEAQYNDPDLSSALVHGCVVSDEQDEPIESQPFTKDPHSTTEFDPLQSINVESVSCTSTASIQPDPDTDL